jgi:hypothetical protein
MLKNELLIQKSSVNPEASSSQSIDCSDTCFFRSDRRLKKVHANIGDRMTVTNANKHANHIHHGIKIELWANNIDMQLI